MKSLWSVLFASFATFALFGCDSDECSTNEDCDDGYYCDHTNDESDDQSEGECVAYESDSGEGGSGGEGGSAGGEGGSGGSAGAAGGSGEVTCSDVCAQMKTDCSADCAGGNIEQLCLSKCTTSNAAAIDAIESCTSAISYIGATSACNASSNRGSGASCTANGASGYCMSTDWCGEYTDTKSVASSEGATGCESEPSNVQCCIDKNADDFPCKTKDGYCSDTGCDGGPTAKNECPGKGTCCLLEE